MEPQRRRGLLGPHRGQRTGRFRPAACRLHRPYWRSLAAERRPAGSAARGLVLATLDDSAQELCGSRHRRGAAVRLAAVRQRRPPRAQVARGPLSRHSRVRLPTPSPWSESVGVLRAPCVTTCRRRAPARPERSACSQARPSPPAWVLSSGSRPLLSWGSRGAWPGSPQSPRASAVPHLPHMLIGPALPRGTARVLHSRRPVLPQVLSALDRRGGAVVGASCRHAARRDDGVARGRERPHRTRLRTLHRQEHGGVHPARAGVRTAARRRCLHRRQWSSPRAGSV